MTESEAVARDDFFDSLLGDFLDESGQLLDRLNDDLLQLDEWVRSLGDDHNQRCDDDLMNEMFRSAHSLKGLSAMLGLGDINNMTHKVENVFDAARKDELIITGDCVELMFQAVDRLVSMVDGLKDADAEEVECVSVLADIQNLLQSSGVERQQSSQEDAERALDDITAELSGQSPDAGDPIASDFQPSETASAAPETPSVETPSVETPSVETPSVETPSVETPSVETPSVETPSVEAPPDPIVDHFEGLEDDGSVPSRYLSIFIDETDLSLDDLTETLLALEGGGSREEIETLLVTSHRIKGSAASVGLNRAAKLAHLMEDLLQNLRDTQGTLSEQVTDAMLTCTDALRRYVDGLRKGGTPPDSFGEHATDLLAARNATEPAETEPAAVEDTSSSPEPAEPTADPTSEQPPETDLSDAQPAPATVTESLRSEVKKRAPEGVDVHLGEVVFQPGLPLVGLKARLVYEKLSNLGEVCHFAPPADKVDQFDELDKVTFGVATNESLDTIARQLRIAGVASSVVEPLAAESTAPRESVAPPDTAESTSEAPVSEVSVPETPSPVPPASTAPPSPAPTSASSAPEPPARAKAPTPKPRPAAQPAPAKSKGRAPDSSTKPTETLRVDIDRLDHLMNLAGQLVINKARFTQIGDRLKGMLGTRQSSQSVRNAFAVLDKMADTDATMPNDKGQLQATLENMRSQARRMQNDLGLIRREVECVSEARASVKDLVEAVHQLDRVSDGIQQSVMDTRMVPIGPLFARFKRVIRDITRGNGKTIELAINGEKTELDKRMIDELSDPLIHMVRNSADHGIELPEVREAAGKPRHGTVTLDAFHRGNSIYIEVTDDGKGLDPEQILNKALAKGIVSEADAEKMTPHQIYQLIWEPGLSTAEKVTEVSGRGMGMDIVKSKIEDISGMVDLDSTPGEGTKLTIKLPLTLAILPSLLVKIDGDVMAMPMESVVEIVSVGREDLATVHGKLTARVRGRVVSTIQLREVFSWNRRLDDPDDAQPEETTLVIVGDEGREIGLSVDCVLGEEDVVIKSMAENYKNVAGIAGASIMGDGRVSLILDLNALIDMASAQSCASGV